MSVQLPDLFTDPIFSSNPGAFGNTLAQPNGSAFGPAASNDIISRMTGPWTQNDLYGTPQTGGSYGSSGLSSIIGQLFSIISQLMSQMGLGNSSANGEQYFTNASGGSVGDPHLSFNGSTWNDMQSESHLLDSNSIPGGYRLSTQTTAPNANGITYNRQATVTTDHGNTQVSLDNAGNATYTQNGVTNALAPGQTVNLGNGETATRNQNGSLTITNTNPIGGCITTTMSENGAGVDVNVTADNVDLGGTLVNGNQNSGPSQQTPPPPTNRPTPIRYSEGEW